MRRTLPLALLTLALIAAALLLFRPRHAATGAGAATQRDPPPPSGAAAAAEPGPPSARAAARARRDELRAQILRALVERGRPTDGGAPPAGAAPGGGAPPADDPRVATDLVDRTGRGRTELMRRLNEDFMPLARDCIAQAEARDAELQGMFVIALETVADEQLGAVVDVADRARLNQVADPELFECIRESAFSLSLPPPPEGGREKFDLSLPIRPERL
jgi:hypothetical protein